MITYNNIRLADPHLPADWRYKRVLQMIKSDPPERCKRYDDKWIQQYKTFMLLYRKNDESRTRLLYEMPGLYYAYQIFDNSAKNDDVALIIESRLLSGMSYEQIAELCKTIPETIEWYERLYFNVTDFLSHKDWILSQVLLPAIDRYHGTMYESDEDDDIIDKFAKKMKVKPIIKSHLDMSLKYFSYFGGPHVCDMMIHGFSDIKHVRSADQVQDFMHENFINSLARRSLQAIQAFEVNKFNVMELLGFHGKIIEVLKTDKSKSDKLTDLEKQFQAFLTDIPWATGRKAKELYEGKEISKYDNSHFELNSEEAAITGSDGKIEIDVPPVDLFARVDNGPK